MKIKEGMTQEGMYKLFADMGFKIGAEVGVWHGKNAVVMFNTIPSLKLYLIDPYKNHPFMPPKKILEANVYEEAKQAAIRRINGKNAVFIYDYSERAHDKIEDNSLDFVFIDGDHSYNFVMLDIILWERKVRKGGIVSGDDYCTSRSRVIDVRLAVEHYAQQHRIDYFVTDQSAPGYDRYFPQWFWIKG